MREFELSADDVSALDLPLPVLAHCIFIPANGKNRDRLIAFDAAAAEAVEEAVTSVVQGAVEPQLKENT